MTTPPYARATAHGSYLILELLCAGDVEGETATSIGNPGRFGQVIMRSPINFAASEEALTLLRKLKSGGDSIGDVDWFRTMDGKEAAFSWLGGPKRLIDTDDPEIETARSFLGNSLPAEQLRKLCTIVPNEPPAEAIEAIDSR